MKKYLITLWLVLAAMVPAFGAGSSVSVASPQVLRSELSNYMDAAKGAALVGVKIGSYGRTLKDRLADLEVSVKDYGAVGDGVVDDTAAIQAALTAVSGFGGTLYFPPGRYRLTATLTAVRGFSVRGMSPVAKAPGGGDFGGGSWLYFDHAGKGISVVNTNGYFTDVALDKIGTYRNQPAPAPGWSPNAHDFDLYVFGVADIRLRDVLMLNPTKGVGIFGDLANGAGRLEIYNFRAQAFQVGIMIDTVYDVVRLDHLHFWPFWRDNMDVHTYTMSNLDAVYSLRNDNPMISNLFTIFARSGLRVGHGVNGGTSKIHMVNADFDRGSIGIWIDDTVGDAVQGATGQFENITHQGETGFDGSKAIWIQGNNSTLAFGNFESGYSWQNAVRVEGTGNRLTFGNARVNQYDQSAIGFAAFEALDSNYLIFATRPVAINSGGGGRYSTTGNIVVDEWREFTPVVSSQSGVIGAASALGLYKVVGDTVTVEFDISITSNGTGGGDIRFDWPFGTPIQNFTGHGREIAINGKSLSVMAQAAGAGVIVVGYDNTYPAADGARLIGTVMYRISN